LSAGGPPKCKDPGGVESYLGQRFLLHGTSGLAFNLLYGRWGRGVSAIIAGDGDTREDFLFMARSAKAPGKSEEYLAHYARTCGERFLSRDLVPNEVAARLNRLEIIVAIDLRGYALLSNKLNLPFAEAWGNWNCVAVCPPPKEFVHVLGILPATAETAALPRGFRPQD
jgi:hypothetical protein